MTYTEWMAGVPALAAALGRPAGDVTACCKEITEVMVAAFPELRRVRGHYYEPVTDREYPHWWCVAPDGTVVDPTAAQFPSQGAGEYREHVEGSPGPTGHCHDCGGYTYTRDPFCSDACREATLAYLNGGPRTP